MKKELLNIRPISIDWGILVLRVFLGGLFTFHGINKLAAFHDILPIFPDPIGIGSTASFVLAVFAELVCGLLVMLGLLTRITILPIFFTMFIAYFFVLANDAFNVKELALVLMIISVVQFILGSGRISLDRLLQNQQID